jgi:transposase
MPEANTFTMQEFLNQFAKTLPKNEIAAMFVDQAGWHASNDLVPPENLVLLPLPAYWPELNPIERVWLFLKERYLSHRLLDDYDSIVDAGLCSLEPAHSRNRTHKIPLQLSLDRANDSRCDQNLGWVVSDVIALRNCHSISS